jgi:protein dithiol:quinone oxidoreductase
MKITNSSVQVGIAAVALGAVGTALITQHYFDMQPCPWCVLQRLIFVTIALVALAGLAWRSASGARVTTLGVIMLGGAGMAAALWHYFVAATSTSCNLTLADRIMNFSGLPALLPDVFEARASCADAAVTLLGVPYVLWALGLFTAMTVAAFWLLLRRA